MSGQVCSVTGEPAIYSYRWQWGEEGYCSEKGRFLLQQNAQNGRHPNAVQFNLLPATEAPPMELEERSRFMGRILALEEELRLKSEKNVNQYNLLEEARRDLRISENQRLSLVTQLEDAQRRLAAVPDQIRTLEREVTRWQEEAIHLRGLVTGDSSQAVRDLESKVKDLELQNEHLQNRLFEAENPPNE